MKNPFRSSKSNKHQPIPPGKIIAKPRSDGGYDLSVYYGGFLGWIPAGTVKPGEDVQAAIRNLKRPIVQSQTHANVQEGKESKGGVNEKPTTAPPDPPKGQGGSLVPCRKCGRRLLKSFTICYECGEKYHLQGPTVDPVPYLEKFESPKDLENILLTSHSREFPEWPTAEKKLRELLFAEHNCDAKYGDDGERQCGNCGIDFRRDSVDEIEAKTSNRNYRRWQKWSEENPDFWNGIQKGKLPDIIGKEGLCKCDGTGKHPIPGALG